MTTDTKTEAIRALIAQWRSLQHKQATEGDGTPIHVGAFHAYKRCADELDALLTAQPAETPAIVSAMTICLDKGHQVAFTCLTCADNRVTQPATVTVSGVTGPDADSINGTHAIAQPAETKDLARVDTTGDSESSRTASSDVGKTDIKIPEQLLEALSKPWVPCVIPPGAVFTYSVVRDEPLLGGELVIAARTRDTIGRRVTCFIRLAVSFGLDGVRTAQLIADSLNEHQARGVDGGPSDSPRLTDQATTESAMPLPDPPKE